MDFFIIFKTSEKKVFQLGIEAIEAVNQLKEKKNK